MDKSQVSRTCKELDALVEEFRNRPLEDNYPDVWFDAVYLKVRQNNRTIPHSNRDDDSSAKRLKTVSTLHNLKDLATCNRKHKGIYTPS
jgi:hypothetical protein